MGRAIRSPKQWYQYPFKLMGSNPKSETDVSVASQFFKNYTGRYSILHSLETTGNLPTTNRTTLFLVWLFGSLYVIRGISADVTVLWISRVTFWLLSPVIDRQFSASLTLYKGGKKCCVQTKWFFIYWKEWEKIKTSEFKSLFQCLN